jgi:ammonia channel protein AmtB
LYGTLDYAGGCISQISLGFSTLAINMIIGTKKISSYGLNDHNLLMTIIGINFMVFGWFALITGSAYMNDNSNSLAQAILNLQISM